jgi:Protein of unknown function (DUF4038)/Domain of unknown function (DUF5060)/Putative collagen-binding domain of a collagenase
MNQRTGGPRRNPRYYRWLLLISFAFVALRAIGSPKLPVVSKWGRFEHSFQSTLTYSNALQDVTLTVVFTSPLGETNQVFGFWDGGKTWLVRFSPNLPGRWTFRSTCSDKANKGLNNQTGEFVCTAAIATTRFARHGQIHVAADRRHFEHADGTPFFWLADSVWNGARISTIKDWKLYAGVRSSQGFTVAQWTATPGADAHGVTAFTGTERISINPNFFKPLDAKLEALSRAGILSAIVPFAQMDGRESAALPDDQIALLLRYVEARWGADPVAWSIRLDGMTETNKIARWKKPGAAIYGVSHRAPVIVAAGQRQQILDEFRDQTWVDAFAYEPLSDLTVEAFRSAISGPFANEWKKEPTRPLIPMAPYENALSRDSKKRFTSDDVRRVIYSNLLLTPPAGISYGAEGVIDWDKTLDQPPKRKMALPLWHRALFMPAAKQLANLSKFVNSIDFWQLRPQPGFVAVQPGTMSPDRFIAAAGTEAKDFSLVYVPQERTLEIVMEALPPSPSVNWFNPRTGQNTPAVAVVGGRSCQFPTPEPGDWLLVMKAGK